MCGYVERCAWEWETHDPVRTHRQTQRARPRAGPVAPPRSALPRPPSGAPLRSALHRITPQTFLNPRLTNKHGSLSESVVTHQPVTHANIEIKFGTGPLNVNLNIGC